MDLISKQDKQHGCLYEQSMLCHLPTEEGKNTEEFSVLNTVIRTWRLQHFDVWPGLAIPWNAE